MRYRQLGTRGPLISELGFGASPLGGIYGGFAENAGIEAVHAALDAGIIFFDVAPSYGLTAAETVLGRALRGMDRDPACARLHRRPALPSTRSCPTANTPSRTGALPPA